MRRDVQAVVHAPPPVTTTLSVCGKDLGAPAFPKPFGGWKDWFCSICNPHLQAGGRESIRPFLPECNAILLANHGAVTIGESLQATYYRMEALEHYAKIKLYTGIIGGEKIFSAEQLMALDSVKNGTFTE